jgi:hypothetical protein
MNRLYVAPTATVVATPPFAHYQSLATPGLPQFSLVVVEHWHSHEAQDTWEALPNVTQHHVWNWGAVVPPAVVTAFGPWGVVATDTIAQAMRKIRAQWPAARL